MEQPHSLFHSQKTRITAKGGRAQSLNQLFALIEKSRTAGPLFTIAKYGVKWSMDEGVIFLS